MPTLNWIGKDRVVTHHHDVPYHVLDHKYGFRSSNPEDKSATESGNMIIHGDNLLALKALLPQYEGRIKCIYIDPPYNTGNEKWVYNDNVNDPRIRKWLGEVVGQQGEDLSRHDKWLCMMYPRLSLLRQLLSEDGAIFISIDDNEQANLKLICDEIFGIRNHVASMPVHRQGGRQDSKFYAVVHEYLYCYVKNIDLFSAGLQLKEGALYSKFDEQTGRYYKTQLLRKWGSNSLRENRPNLYYSIKAPDGSAVYPVIYSKSTNSDRQFDKIDGRWRWSASNMERAMQENRVEFVKNEYGEWTPYERIYAPAAGEIETKKFTTWVDEIGNGTKVLKEIFAGNSPFDYPKSEELVELVINMANAKGESIVLDSFAGSGTTAHAVLNLNKQDGGHRRFILCEMCDYAENITAERVRRVMNGYGEGKNVVEGTGGEFDFYELGEPLFCEDGNLNEAIGEDKIREYIYYSETRQPLTRKREDGSYLLDKHNDVGYYFYYKKDSLTVLSIDTLNIVTERADSYVIYADICNLSPEKLMQYNIIFKQIPRDIKQF